jgi:hypothetical protein
LVSVSAKKVKKKISCLCTFKTGYWKDFQNRQEISKEQAKTLSLFFSSTMQQIIVKTSAHVQKVLFIIRNPKTSFLRYLKMGGLSYTRAITVK